MVGWVSVLCENPTKLCDNKILNSTLQPPTGPIITSCCPSPIGFIQIHCQNETLIALDISQQSTCSTLMDAFSKEVMAQLQAYFKNPAHVFTIKVNLKGTLFQKRLWQHLLSIPAGQVKSYGELAGELETSPRAIGQACRMNPVPIIVPCHRIVAKNALGGYSGATSGYPLQTKTWLLRHEGAINEVVV